MPMSGAVILGWATHRRHQVDGCLRAVDELPADPECVLVKAEPGRIGRFFVDDFVEEHSGLFGRVESSARRIARFPFSPPYLLLALQHRLERLPQMLKLIRRYDLP